MVYRLINHAVGRTREKFVNHEPHASDLRILPVFYQHPKWFIETCGLSLLYNDTEDARENGLWERSQ